MSVNEKQVIAEPEKNEKPKENIAENVGKPQESESPKETQDQINWKLFRDQREKERKEKLALEQEAIRKSEEIAALKASLEAVLTQQRGPVSDSSNQISDEDLSEEERIQKQVNAAVEAALKQKEQREAKERAEREIKETPRRLEQSFPDFNQVCTTENLDYFEYHYPEVAAAFKGQPDSFDKWANIYKSLKRFIPNSSTAYKEAVKAEKNLSKPQSISVPGMAVTGDTAPHKLDDQRRADNWARMQRIMKGV